MKKAQITMFIALGLILVGIVGMGLYVYNFRVIDEKDQDVRGTLSDQTQLTNVKKVVESCLRSVGTDALRMIAEQGGAIYRSQGGVHDATNALRLNYGGERLMVQYGLRRRTDLPAPPYYPYGDPKTSWAELSREHPSIRFFGDIEMPALCARQGPNAPDNPNGYFTCPTYAYGYSERTMQDQLRSYIMRKMPDCIDPQLDKLKTKTTGEKSLEIVFGDDHVRANAIYGLRINDKTDLENISVSFPVRIKRMYQLAYRILEADARDPTFDKTYHYRKLNDCRFGNSTTHCWDKDLRVYVLADVYEKDDVLRIEDDASLLAGQPLVFNIGVENRGPMLDRIYRAENNSWANMVDIVGFSGKGLTIVPVAYDPDEENLTYRYLLWGETENATYPTQYGCDDDNVTDALYDPMADCAPESTPGEPHRWTTASDYTDPSYCGNGFEAMRCSTIHLTDRDRGPHKVRVSVHDAENLYDYQVISILVR